MKVSLIRSITMPGKGGKLRWVEIGQKFTPPGGKKFKVGFSAFGAIFAAMGFIHYTLIQTSFNPDSIYAKYANAISNYHVNSVRDSCPKETAYEEYAKSSTMSL